MTDLMRTKLNRRQHQLGLTRYAIAKRAGVAQSTVDRIMDGETQDPGFDLVSVIAIALCMEVRIVPAEGMG